MKKLIGFGIVAMLVAGIMVGMFMSKDDVVEQDVSDMVQELRDRSNGSKYQVFNVVEKHGFMVLDKKEKDENHTTIVVEVKDGSEHGFEMADGEVVAENIFDNADFVVLTPEEAKGLNMGGIYLITFSHDYIDTIVENELVIANKVFGQIIGDEI